MLQHSFVHLPGIGPETEERFWQAGVRNWDDLESRLPELVGVGRADRLRAALDEARAAYEAREYAFFHQRLKSNEIWRLVPEFLLSERQDKIAYLDIETTGLGFPPQCQSTSVAVVFGGQLHVEHEPDRKRKLFQRLDAEAELLVTFNGGTFDLPFLRREFGLAFAQAHLDLRYWMQRLGYRGGLKKIQQAFTDVRQRDSMDIDGYDAVRLWRLHQRGVPGALETLYTYNAEDTVVLMPLVHRGLRLEAERRSHLGLPDFPEPLHVPITTQVSPEVYRMLRGGTFGV